MHRWNILVWLLLLSGILPALPLNDNPPVNDFITYYEPIKFNGIKEDKQHLSVDGDAGKSEQPWSGTIDISAYGRDFTLSLASSSRVLPPTAEITIYGLSDGCEGRPMDVKDILSTLVEGNVVNETSSYVHGTLRQGKFNGIIRVGNQSFFVEKASRFFREKVSFDAIVFRYEDLNMSSFECGADNTCRPIQLIQKMGPFSYNVKPIDNLPYFDGIKEIFRKHFGPKNICRMKLVADSDFYQYDGEGTVETAIQDMIFHANEADRIFRDTDFNGDMVADNVGFEVHSVELYTKPECLENPELSKSHPLSDDYLDAFSERDFHNYCMGIAFSGHTFPGRVLGIAWMADANNAGYVGGICEPRLFSSQNNKALSFNTGVITVMLEGRRLPKAITSIALSHELGHSFGSDHDPYYDAECSPNKESGGKYIMAVYAVKGDRPNNRRFSPCSQKSISNVIKKKATCFTSALSVTCGNGVVEQGEECDCGPPPNCNSADSCCVPKGGDKLDKECTLKKKSVSGKVCKPDEQKCCGDGCKIQKDKHKKKKKDTMSKSSDDECDDQVICSESQGGCRKSYPRAKQSRNEEDKEAQDSETAREEPNSTEVVESDTGVEVVKLYHPIQGNEQGPLCQNGLGNCLSGVCILDPCRVTGLESCQCEDPQLHCKVCCRDGDVGTEECLLLRSDGTLWRREAIVKDAPDLLTRVKGWPCTLQDLPGRCSENGICEALASVTTNDQGTDKVVNIPIIRHRNERRTGKEEEEEKEEKSKDKNEKTEMENEEYETDYDRTEVPPVQTIQSQIRDMWKIIFSSLYFWIWFPLAMLILGVFCFFFTPMFTLLNNCCGRLRRIRFLRKYVEPMSPHVPGNQPPIRTEMPDLVLGPDSYNPCPAVELDKKIRRVYQDDSFDETLLR